MPDIPIATPSTPILPSSQAPSGILRTPSSTLAHPSTKEPNPPALASGNSSMPSGGSSVSTRQPTPGGSSSSSSSVAALAAANAAINGPSPMATRTLRPALSVTSNSHIHNSHGVTKYEKNLNRKSADVSIDSFAFLFSETIQYLQKQATGIQDLEKRLNLLGYHMGQRVLELVTIREGKNAKRETKVIGILQFVYITVWKSVFGKSADALEKSNENDNEYMIIDLNPMITRFISVPKEMSQLNCAALAAGVIEGVLDGALFTADVTAHTVETPEHPNRTVFLIKFDPKVIEREKSFA